MRCQHCSQSSPLHSLCHTGSNDEECGFGGNDCSRSMQVAAILEPLFGFTIKILFGSKKEECVTAEQYRPAKIEKKDWILVQKKLFTNILALLGKKDRWRLIDQNPRFVTAFFIFFNIIPSKPFPGKISSRNLVWELWVGDGGPSSHACRTLSQSLPLGQTSVLVIVYQLVFLSGFVPVMYVFLYFWL